MSAPIGADWKVGDRVFVRVRFDGCGDDVGYVATITHATATRVKISDRAWTRDGRPYGNNWMHLRPLQDGDEARDAARRDALEEAARECERLAALYCTGVDSAGDFLTAAARNIRNLKEAP